MTRRMTVLVAGAAVATLGLTACSGGSGSATAGGGDTGEQRQEGDLHQAGRRGVLQGPHRGVLEAVRREVQGQDRQHPGRADRQLGRDRPAEQHDDPEQQRAGHPQPQRLRQLRQGQPALQRRRRALPARSRATCSTPSSRAAPTRARCTACRTCRPRGRCSTTRPCSPRRASPRRRRPGTSSRPTPRSSPRLGGGSIGYAMPLGPEEAQAEFSIWMFNNGGDWKSDGKWTINSPKNVETLSFLKKLAVQDKVTQNNPGKTNRADAFPLFKSGNVGMVVGFSPLAADLDKDKKVNYGVAPMPTKAAAQPQTFGVTDYLMAFKKPGNQDGRQGVLRPVLPEGPGQHVHQGRGLPAGHQDRPAGVRVRPEAEGLPRDAAQRPPHADRRPHLGQGQARRPAEHRRGHQR